MAIVLEKSVEEKGFSRKVLRKVDDLDLGRYNSQFELYRKIYENHGPGRFSIKDYGGKNPVIVLFKGNILDREENLVVEVDNPEDDEKLEKYGLPEAGWGEINYLTFPKKGD